MSLFALVPGDGVADSSNVDFFICSKSEQNLLHRKRRLCAKMLCEIRLFLVLLDVLL